MENGHVPTGEDVAYLAGIVDGEGSICIKRQDAQYNPQFKLLLRVMNTSRDLIDHLQGIFGGHVHQMKQVTREKTLYELWWAGYDAKPLLELLVPYLVIKKEQAELGIDFQNFVAKRHESRGLKAKQSELDIEVQDVLYECAKELNL